MHTCIAEFRDREAVADLRLASGGTALLPRQADVVQREGECPAITGDGNALHAVPVSECPLRFQRAAIGHELHLLAVDAKQPQLGALGRTGVLQHELRCEVNLAPVIGRDHLRVLRGQPQRTYGSNQCVADHAASLSACIPAHELRVSVTGGLNEYANFYRLSLIFLHYVGGRSGSPA